MLRDKRYRKRTTLLLNLLFKRMQTLLLNIMPLRYYNRPRSAMSTLRVSNDQITSFPSVPEVENLVTGPEIDIFCTHEISDSCVVASLSDFAEES